MTGTAQRVGKGMDAKWGCRTVSGDHRVRKSRCWQRQSHSWHLWFPPSTPGGACLAVTEARKVGEELLSEPQKGRLLSEARQEESASLIAH